MPKTPQQLVGQHRAERGSGSHDPSATTLRALIRSREGYRVLCAICGDNPPGWFSTLQSDAELGRNVREIVTKGEKL